MMLTTLFPSRDLPLETKQIMHSIESVVIEWCHQVRDVLQNNSAQPLLEGKNPGPLVEIEFWRDRCMDLQYIMEQVLAHVHPGWVDPEVKQTGWRIILPPTHR